MPVTETEIVVAKWLAGVVMYCALLVPFFLYLPFLYFQAKFDFDLGPIMSLALGLTTMGMMFVAIGLFLSSLTRNQIIAAIWTFVVLALPDRHLSRSSISSRAAAHSPGPTGSVSWPCSTRFRASAMGQLDFRYLAVHLSVSFFVLSLTVKVARDANQSLSSANCKWRP